MDRTTFGPAVREWAARNLDVLPRERHEGLQLYLKAGEWGIVVEAFQGWLEYRDPLREMSGQDIADFVTLLEFMDNSPERIERLRQRLARAH